MNIPATWLDDVVRNPAGASSHQVQALTRIARAAQDVALCGCPVCHSQLPAVLQREGIA